MAEYDAKVTTLVDGFDTAITRTIRTEGARAEPSRSVPRMTSRPIRLDHQ